MQKTFDCVEMKRRGAEYVMKQIEGLSREEQLAFWRERTEALRQKQRMMQEMKRQAISAPIQQTRGDT